MLYNTGTDIVKSTHGLVTTVRLRPPLTFQPSSSPSRRGADEVLLCDVTQVAYKMGKDKPMHYALEGSIAVGGSSVTWFVHRPRSTAHLSSLTVRGVC
jgi:glycerol kinase